MTAPDNAEAPTLDKVAGWQARLTQVADDYGIADPAWPLVEYGMPRRTAKELILFALDAAGVPRTMFGLERDLVTRVGYLAAACKEAEDA